MIDSSKILSSIPKGLRDPLIHCYREIISNFSEHRWEPSELNGGKFCEVVYTIINGYLTGSYPNSPSKPRDMVVACRGLEGIPANSSRTGDRSVRILIPRMLLSLYEIRNNRGVGHVGGDVNPNFLDATAVCSIASWVLAEIIRVFHNVSTKDAQEIVDALIERKHPLIWEVEGVRRVLDSSMKKGDQVLLLLHTRPTWSAESDVFSWVEYSTLNNLRKNIFEPFHKSRLVEYDKKQGRVRISPLGVKEVESRILKID